jgi:2-hydroxy-3-oxopropionate reductase
VSSCIHRTTPPAQLIDAGLILLDSPRAVAESSEVVITMLPDTPQVTEVLLGEQGVLAGLKIGSTIIDMSSISPEQTRVLAKAVSDAGCDYLDAPVSGGQSGAQAATLSIMVGAETRSFEDMLPLLAILGSNITHVGDVGSGQVCKIANQIIVGLNIEAVAEALLFASRAGADPARVRDALMGGFASSKVLEVHAQKMIDRQFQPGFRIDLHRKDLNLATTAARELNLALPNTAQTLQLFNACAAEEGGGDLDHSALVTALEKCANHTLA